MEASPPGMQETPSWHGKSFQPMSIVTNATNFRCACRKLTASSSWEPCG